MNEKLALTVREAAKEMSVGLSTAYKLVNSAVWPSARVGKTIIIPVSGLRAWLAEQSSDTSLSK